MSGLSENNKKQDTIIVDFTAPEEDLKNIKAVKLKCEQRAMRKDIFTECYTTFVKQVQVNEKDKIFFWSYRLSIFNNTEDEFKIITRNIMVIDEFGVVARLQADHVLGKKSDVLPKNGLEYNSVVFLPSPSGFIYGSCNLLNKKTSKIITVDVQSCSLDSDVKITTFN
jgi:uncharacterized protein affecting Mg2+/Co2+ transport